MDSGNTVSRLINAKIKYNGGEKMNKIFKTNNGIVHFCKIYNFSPGSVKLRLDKKLFKPYHGWNFFSINN